MQAIQKHPFLTTALTVLGAAGSRLMFVLLSQLGKQVQAAEEHDGT